MLKKKGGPAFKPKAGVRRNALPASQDRQSKTPAPVPSSAPSEIEPQEPATIVTVAGPVRPDSGATQSTGTTASSDAATTGTAAQSTRPSVSAATAPQTSSSRAELPSSSASPRVTRPAPTTVAAAPSPAAAPPPSGAGLQKARASSKKTVTSAATEKPTEKPTEEAAPTRPANFPRSQAQPVVLNPPSAHSSEPTPVQTPAPPIPSSGPAATEPSSRPARKRRAPAATKATGSTIEPSEEPSAPPAKRRRATKAQSASKEPDTANGVVTEEATPAPRRKTQPPKSAPAVDQEPVQEDPPTDSANGATSGSQKKQTRQRKAPARTAKRGACGKDPKSSATSTQDTPTRQRSASGPPTSSEIGSGTDEQDGGESARPTKKRAPRKPRKERSVTPEDAEDRVIDPNTTTVGALTKDMRIGKKFSRHDELVKRMKNLTNKNRRRQEGDGSGPGDGSGADNGASSSSTAAGGNKSSAEAPPALALSGPQFEIVNGMIVVNQASLVHNRHAAAAAEQEDMEEVEENDFTRMTNAMTYLKPNKLRGPNSWSKEETEMFYSYLEMMGSDFSLLTPMFPGRQRRHLKMKFNREERHNPARINAALLGPKRAKIDLEEYQNRTGKTLEATETIEAEHQAREEAHEAEQRRIQEEADNLQLEKRKKLLGTGADGDDPSSPGGDGKKEAAGKKIGAGGASADVADPETEDVEIIDEAEVVRPPPRRGGRKPMGGGIGA